ncbi:PH domain-containing protein [Niallia endozanthoxylica]|uniref:PH domain-containing protein n=1 Tax=Niallia endozanthoxylica TaxID=2036016 RepID=UPI001CC7B2A7|nr:PH domain-containing protein [Niallia endozanthoxylica]
MVFTSRKDLWMGIVIWALIVAFIWVFYQSVFVQFNIVGIIVMVVMSYLLGTIWFNTQYKIENDTLKISYGPIKRRLLYEKLNPFGIQRILLWLPHFLFIALN